MPEFDVPTGEGCRWQKKLAKGSHFDPVRRNIAVTVPEFVTPELRRQDTLSDASMVGWSCGGPALHSAAGATDSAADGLASRQAFAAFTDDARSRREGRLSQLTTTNMAGHTIVSYIPHLDVQN